MTTPHSEQDPSNPNSDPTLKLGNQLLYAGELEILQSKEVGPEQTFALAKEIIGEKAEALQLANGHTVKAGRKRTNPAGWAPNYVGEENLAAVYVPTVGSRMLVTNPTVLGSSGEPKLGALNGVIRNAARLLRHSARPDHATFESKLTKGGLSTASTEMLSTVELTVLQGAISRFVGDEAPTTEEVVSAFAAWAACDKDVAATFIDTLSGRIAERVLPNIGTLNSEGSR